MVGAVRFARNRLMPHRRQAPYLKFPAHFARAARQWLASANDPRNVTAIIDSLASKRYISDAEELQALSFTD